jgi:hypothetical protein
MLFQLSGAMLLAIVATGALLTRLRDVSDA